MFTWICPTCGREVPPAYDKCPDCVAKGITGDAPAAGTLQDSAPAPPSAPVTPAIPSPAAPPQYSAPPPGGGLPTWLLAILFAFAFVGLGGGVYWLVHYFSAGGTQAAATAEAPIVPAQTASPAAEHPMQKYIEVSGIRFVESAKKGTEARFLVINHSGAEVADLAGTVNIFGRAGKTSEAAGTFKFNIPSVGPYESREATAPVATSLKVYELPDWQFITTEVQITSP